MSLPALVSNTTRFKGKTLWIVPEIPGPQGEGKAYSRRCFFCSVQERVDDDLTCLEGIACGRGSGKTIGIYPEQYEQCIAHATSLKLTGEP